MCHCTCWPVPCVRGYCRCTALKTKQVWHFTSSLPASDLWHGVCVCTVWEQHKPLSHLPLTTLEMVVMVTLQMLLMNRSAMGDCWAMIHHGHRSVEPGAFVSTEALAVVCRQQHYRMQQHQARRSFTGEMLARVKWHDRRCSASDILLRVLQRQCRSALEFLSSSSHTVMVAVSMNQPQSQCKTSRCNHTEENEKCCNFYDIFFCKRRISFPFLLFVPLANTRVPTAKYTKMGETLRHVIPGHMQCSMACGGKACKYENPSRWSDEEQAIKGLYSSWYVDILECPCSLKWADVQMYCSSSGMLNSRI